MTQDEAEKEYRYEVEVSMPAHADVDALKIKVTQAKIFPENKIDIFFKTLHDKKSLVVKKDITKAQADKVAKKFESLGFRAISSPILSLIEVEKAKKAYVCPACDEQVELTEDRQCPACEVYVDNLSEEFLLKKKIMKEEQERAKGIQHLQQKNEAKEDAAALEKRLRAEIREELKRKYDTTESATRGSGIVLSPKKKITYGVAAALGAVLLFGAGWFFAPQTESTPPKLANAPVKGAEDMLAAEPTGLMDGISVENGAAVFDGELLAQNTAAGGSGSLLGTSSIAEQAALADSVRQSHINAVFTDQNQKLLLAKRYQIKLCQMGYASQVQRVQTAIAGYEKANPLLEVQQANVLLDACQIGFEAKPADGIKQLAPAFARANNPNQVAWLGYQAVAMLLAPNTLHGNKAALILLGDWNKQLEKTKAAIPHNGWLAAMSLLVQRNMQSFIARGDFARANGALQKMHELRAQAKAPFATALIAGIMYDQYTSVSNTTEAQNALDDFVRSFDEIETNQEKLRVLSELQRFSRIVDTDAFLENLLKTAVAAINTPEDGSAMVAASTVLVGAGLEEQATEVKNNLSVVESPKREQQIAAAAVYDQMARARYMQKKGDSVAAAVLMDNLSKTLTQFE